MEEMHVHEVLFMMINGKSQYDNRLDFIDEIKSTFGNNVCFSACSAGSMSPEDVYDFLIMKNKIIVDTDGKIKLSEEMTMCNGHDHDHDHDHDHNH